MERHVAHAGAESPPLEADFEAFFAAEYARLCQALLLLIGDRFEAEDVAQEAMTRVLERWDRVHAMDSPAGYLFRTALNLHRNGVRRLAVRTRRVFAETPAADHAPTVDDQEDVRRALAALPRNQREALILVDWLELSTDEAGDVLDLTANAVRVRLHRARSVLRQSLGGAR